MTAPQKLATTGIIALLLGGALVSASPLVATAEDLPERAPTDAAASNTTAADDKKQCPWLPEDATGRFENGKLVIEWTVQDPNPYESFIVGYPGTPVDRDARSWVDPTPNYSPGALLPTILIAICDSSLPDGSPGHASSNTGQPVRVPGGPEIPGDISSLATSSTNQAAYTNSDSRADSGSDATAETGADGTASAAASAGSAGSADDAATAASGTSVGTDTSAETDTRAGTGADTDGGRPAADTHSSAEAESGSSAEAGSAAHTATALESAHADATTAGHETGSPTPPTAITEAGAPKQLAETGGQGSSPLLTGIGAAFAALGGTLVAAAARRRRLDREAS